MVVINLDYAKFSVCKQSKHFSPDIWIQISLILEYDFSVCLSMFGMKGERGKKKQHEYFECYFWMHVTTDNFIEMKRNVQQCNALLTHFNHIHFFSLISNHIDRAISCDCFFFCIFRQTSISSMLKIVWTQRSWTYCIFYWFFSMDFALRLKFQTK